MLRNWNEFHRDDANKTELFLFLILKTASLETQKTKLIIITHHKDIRFTQPRKTTGLAPFTQEEADTWISLHFLDAANHGYSKVMNHTVDYDVLVLAMSAVNEFHIDELGLPLAQVKAFDREIEIHSLDQRSALS